MSLLTKGDPVLVNHALKQNYESYYEDSKFSERERAWRQLGARYKANHVIEICADVPHRNILDIGAGDGAVSAELSSRGFSSDISCVELSTTGVEAIKRRNLSTISDVQAFDGYHIPYPERHFDLAFASHVLEHVEHERLFIYEAMRVSKYLFIEVPLEDTLRKPLDYTPMRARYVDQEVGHINFYNYKTLRHMLQTCGGTVIDQRLLKSPFAFHRFHGRARDYLEFVVRRMFDSVSLSISARLFSHHCGILCATKPDS
jgi:ubiquinone/menaquinone biosynthesis C-methylase UbiE